MTRPPAFQAYATDLLALYTGLSLPALGAVHRLVLLIWAQSPDQCSILDDDQLLSRAVGATLDEWKILRDEIQHPGRAVFEEKNGRLVSPYLREQGAKQRKYRRLQSEKAKKSVEARLNRGSAGAEARGSFPIPTPIPTPIPIPKEEKEGEGETPPPLSSFSWREGFGKFWEAYPKKIGNGSVEAWFKQHRPNDELVQRMIGKLTEMKQSKSWQEADGKYIPAPITWLEEKRWNDEVEVRGLPPKKRIIYT